MKQSENETYRPFIPNNVAHMVARRKIPLVKAWRIRLNMTIEEIAAAANIQPEEVVILEEQHNAFSPSLMKVAYVMNLDIGQLTDIVH